MQNSSIIFFLENFNYQFTVLRAFVYAMGDLRLCFENLGQVGP